VRAQCWMALFDRQFDILGIMVPPSDDNQVLEAAGDEQFSILEKSQVSCTQKWTLSAIRKMGAERVLRFLAFLPVSLGDAGTRYPDLSHLVRQAAGQGEWIGNHDLLLRSCLATAHQCARACMLGEGFDGQVLLKWGCLKCSHDRYGRFLTAANNEGC